MTVYFNPSSLNKLLGLKAEEGIPIARKPKKGEGEAAQKDDYKPAGAKGVDDTKAEKPKYTLRQLINQVRQDNLVPLYFSVSDEKTRNAIKQVSSDVHDFYKLVEEGRLKKEARDSSLNGFIKRINELIEKPDKRQTKLLQAAITTLEEIKKGNFVEEKPQEGFDLTAIKDEKLKSHFGAVFLIYENLNNEGETKKNLLTTLKEMHALFKGWKGADKDKERLEGVIDLLSDNIQEVKTSNLPNSYSVLAKIKMDLIGLSK